ncbi:uncharacterized protein VDAG_04160 [Verticillium dahliae VdLs.17]|uniref:Uncharacterized protein n=1 Tax=Verticillium dahliae (strain VdLs.17 / ATCC MYA-4575 / FGSC 10137) TaxID=498257 RepID=G2X2W6_VERDV|nr:uncharacterized protein VDAG_04160 [Verticillium dahliae VdLs.17]EGY22722.1 hypothetical protein VDAG_04160 [Verticillium dahliae VdLs.17]KAH6700495.1 hypothetical protein EV126DRAFT_477326 [Verticillium dahliae]
MCCEADGVHLRPSLRHFTDSDDEFRRTRGNGLDTSKLPVHDRDSIRCAPYNPQTSRPKPQSSARGPHALRLGHQSTPLPRELPNLRAKDNGPMPLPSCRRFITATLRSFPRLMAQLAKWPAFIHPLVSSPHFDERDVEPPPTTPQPLKPLAACSVISQGFVAQSEGSMDFLWRSIEAEERWIKSDVSISPKRNGRSVQLTDAQMHKFSLGELLAAMQAMVIYTIMRMIDFGPDYFTEHDGMIVTMQDLAYVYSSCVPGPFSPPHERKAGFRWKDWLCEEVRRR